MTNLEKELIDALTKCRSYIYSLKGKEFNIRNNEFFSISAVLAEAFNKVHDVKGRD